MPIPFQRLSIEIRTEKAIRRVVSPAAGTEVGSVQLSNHEIQKLTKVRLRLYSLHHRTKRLVYLFPITTVELWVVKSIPNQPPRLVEGLHLFEMKVDLNLCSRI